MLKSEIMYVAINFKEEVEWLKESFKGMSIKEIKIPRKKGIEDFNSSNDKILYKVYRYFQENPTKTIVSLDKLDSNFKPGNLMSKETISQLSRIAGRDYAITRRSAELKEILILNQIIDTVEASLIKTLELLREAYPLNNEFIKNGTTNKNLQAMMKTMKKWYKVPNKIYDDLLEYKSTRNVHTHHRGLISQNYLDYHQSNGFTLNDYRSLTENDNYIPTLFDTVLLFISHIIREVLLRLTNDKIIEP